MTGGGHFDAHADVDGVGAHAHAEPATFVDEPRRALAPGRENDGVGADSGCRRCSHTGGRAVLDRDALDGGAGAHRDARFEVDAHGREDVGGAVAAHVAHRRGDQRHAVRAGPGGEMASTAGLMAPCTWVGRAEVDPDVVDVVHEVGQGVVADELAEPAADLGRERELAVGEGAGAAPAAGDVARRAVGAAAGTRAGQTRLSMSGPCSSSSDRAAVADARSSSAAKMPAGPAPAMTQS